MIEFYHGDDMIASINSGMVPPVGSLINIRKKTWKVVRVTYALDHADDIREKRMRANIDLETP